MADVVNDISAEIVLLPNKATFQAAQERTRLFLP